MILGNPTEITMGSDEKRSGRQENFKRATIRNGHAIGRGEATNWRTPIWNRSEITPEQNIWAGRHSTGS
jgi:hypothetical protein